MRRESGRVQKVKKILMFRDDRKKRKKNKNQELMSLIESLPERYKKTALRKIENGEKLEYDPIKGIINAEGLIIVDNDYCKDKVKQCLNVEEDEEESKGEAKEEKKKIEGIVDEQSDEEEYDYEEEEEEEDEENDKPEEESKEEIINTFKDKKAK
jgi:hypothetical protein